MASKLGSAPSVRYYNYYNYGTTEQRNRRDSRRAAQRFAENCNDN